MSHMDQLLEEYLRVINDKDDALHKLMKDNESLRALLKKKEDTFRTKTAALRDTLSDKESEISRLKSKAEEDSTTIDKLINANEERKMQLEQARRDDNNVKEEAAAAALKAKATKDALDAVERVKQDQERQLAGTRALLSEAEARIADLNAKLASIQQAQNETDRKFKDSDAHSQSLAIALAAETEKAKALEVAKAQAASDHKEKSQQHEQLARELAHFKSVAADIAEKLAAAQRTAASRDDQLRQSTEDLQRVRLEQERGKAAAERSEDGLRMQLKSLQEQTRATCEELERNRRQLESKEMALRDANNALAAAKDEASKSIADLRERLAMTTASSTAAKAERDRMAYDLKHAQQQLTDAASQAARDQTMLARKLEETEAAAQRAQQQLRDKEEALRTAELVHGREIENAKHAHAVALEEVRRAREAEVQDVTARLERCRAELSDRAGGHKGLEKEVELSAGTHQRLRDEVGRLGNALALKEEAVISLKREMEVLSARLTQQEQRHVSRDATDEQLRKRAEAAEAQVTEARATVKVLEAEVAEKERRMRACADAEATLRGELQERNTTLQQVRREAAELAKAEQAALKEAAAHDVQKERATHRMQAAMEESATLREAAAAAQREAKEALQAARKAEDALREAQGELREKDAECKRLAQHASHVEDLARTTAAELQRSVQARDDTIVVLHQEVATVKAQLAEEQTRARVEEADVQRTMEVAELARSHAESAAATAQKQQQTQQRQLEDALAKLASAQETLEAREAKYHARKEELRAAVQELNTAQTEAAEVQRRASAEVAAAAELRERYKKEKAKMQVLAQQLEEKAAAADRREKATRQREASLKTELQATEEQLRTAHAGIEARQGDAAERVAQLEQRCSDLVIALQESQSAASLADHACRELMQRQVQQSRRAVETFVSDVCAMKQSLGEAALAQLSSSVTLARMTGYEQQRICRSARQSVTEAEARLARALQDGASARAAEAQALRAELAEATARTTQRAADAQQRESELREVQAALTRADSRIEVLQREKESADARATAARAELDEGRRALWRQQETLQSRLNDSDVERRHSEEELREVKAEVAALQRVIAEKDSKLSLARDAQQNDATRLAQASASRDALQSQCEELRRQLADLRKHLENASATHKKTLDASQQALRRAEERADAGAASLATAQQQLAKHERQVQAQDQKIEALTREAQALRRQEAELVAELQARKAEISALRERCANLDSLKNISEASLSETQIRERELLLKLEELRNAQQLMQLCFDKQQEQLEIGRRLRNQPGDRRSY